MPYMNRPYETDNRHTGERRDFRSLTDFKRIARGRDELHSDLSSDLLERIAGQFFHLLEKCQLPNGRVLYAFAKKDP